MVTVTERLGIEGAFLSILRTVSSNPVPSIVLMGEQSEPSCLDRNKTEVFTLCFYSVCAWVSQSSKTR